MKADKSKMFSVALEELGPEKAAPFPLYVFLSLNNRMVLVRIEGDALGKEKYEELKREHHETLWVPKSHEKECSAYLEYLEKTKNNPIQDNAEEAISAEDSIASKSAADQINKKMNELLQSGGLDNSANKSEMVSLAQGLFQELTKIKISGNAARLISASKCAAFANSMLSMISDSDPLYNSVLALRAFQEPTEHSVFVGSLATIMAVSKENIEPIWIADLLVASTFHDLGMSEIQPEILHKAIIDLNAEERLEFETHVQKGCDLLKNSEDKIPDDVIRMIQEHHERADGTGFPQKNMGDKMLLGSRFLFLANEFDRICRGNDSGKKYSPSEAITKLEEMSPLGSKNAEILTELKMEQ